MTVDFHVHSAASDGTCTPTELLACATGVDVLAITDHDNCDGAEEFASARVPSFTGRRLVGIELSVEPGEGFDKFHLLGLGVDPANAALKAFLRRVLEGRNARNAKIIANFAKIGIDIPTDEIARYAHGEVLARPHFANWLVDHGHAADRAEAFAKYLLRSSPDATRCSEERWHPPREEAFAVVHGAGGLCVMAHPKYWRRDWSVAGPDYAAAERALAELREMGLDGLEALYQANTVEESVRFSRLADSVGLVKSAGSDFHGTNKPQIALGMEVRSDFIAPLLERLEGRFT